MRIQKLKDAIDPDITPAEDSMMRLLLLLYVFVVRKNDAGAYIIINNNNNILFLLEFEKQNYQWYRFLTIFQNLIFTRHFNLL